MYTRTEDGDLNACGRCRAAWRAVEAAAAVSSSDSLSASSQCPAAAVEAMGSYCPGLYFGRRDADPRDGVPDHSWSAMRDVGTAQGAAFELLLRRAGCRGTG